MHARKPELYVAPCHSRLICLSPTHIMRSRWPAGSGASGGSGSMCVGPEAGGVPSCCGGGVGGGGGTAGWQRARGGALPAPTSAECWLCNAWSTHLVKYTCIK